MQLELDKVDFRLLKTFLVLMSELNVSNASIQLNTTQSSISQTLARLRKIFDDPLLLKSHSGMIATDRAKALESSIRRIVDEYDSLLKHENPFEPGRSERKFVLTASIFAEHMLVPAFIERLRVEAPYIQLEIRPPNPEKAFELLENGDIDLRIAWSLTPQLSLRSAPLFQDRMVCIVNANHPEVKEELSLEQFLRLPHARSLVAARTTTVRVVDEALKKLGKKMIAPIILQDLFTIPPLVATTDVISVMPRSLATKLAAFYNLRILESPLRLPRVKYVSYWHERNQLDPGHRWLRHMVQEAARNLGSFDKTLSL